MARRFLIFAAALLILCGSLVAWGATAAERDFMLRGYVNPTQSTDLPFRIPRLGINADLTAAPNPAAELAHMAMMGAVWVRQRVSWRAIENTPNAYDWSAWDRVAAAFTAHPQMKWIPVLVESPDWARTQGSATAPPDDPARFAAFAAAFAQRYGDLVDHYQIWDEPNLSDAWGGLDPQPAAYLALLAEAYAAIHAHDEDAIVIAAALAPTTQENARNQSDLSYLRALYALGAAEVMDAAAAKPYGFGLPPTDRRVRPDTLNFSRLVALREIMTEFGDGKTALWASEWGWNHLPDGWTGAPSIWGSVSDTEQVSYTLAALDRADREWAWLGGMILQTWQHNAPADDPRWGFAVIDQNGAPTPLFEALAARPAQTTARDGVYPPANPYTRYSGVWTFGELGADIGWVQDSRFSFDFSGSAAALLLRRDNYLAFLYPTIDGMPLDALPRDPNGTPFIALRSAALSPSVDMVMVASRLPLSDHTLSVTADRGWDRWALVGMAVSSGDLGAPYTQQIGVAIAAALLAAAAAGVTAAQIDWRPLAARLMRVWRLLGAAGQIGISGITSAALMIGMLLTWREPAPAIFTREPVQVGAALVTAGLIYLQPHIVIVIAAALALFWIIYQRLDYGLLLTIFYAPFFLFPVELARFAFPMSEIMLLLTVSAAALRGLAAWGRQRQAIPGFLPSIRLNALDLGLAAWLVMSIVSLAWTEYRAPALTELRTLIIEPIGFYLVFRLLRRDFAIDLRLIDALIVAGVVVSVIGLAMYASGSGIITAEGGSGRLAGVYGSPNNMGLIVGRCIPFALAFALMPVDRRRRTAAALAIIPMGAALLLTQSAGALFVGVPIALAGVLLLIYGRRARLPLLALVGIGAAGLLAALQSARFERLLDFAQGTTFFRIRVWASAIQAIQDRPLTGLGLDQFLYAFQGRYMMPDAWQEPSLSHPHQLILDLWTRLGIGGVLIFLWLQVTFWRTMRRTYQTMTTDPVRRAAAIGTMGCMINLLAHGMVDNSVFVLDLALVFALLVGLAARSGAIPDSTSGTS